MYASRGRRLATYRSPHRSLATARLDSKRALPTRRPAGARALRTTRGTMGKFVSCEAHITRAFPFVRAHRDSDFPEFLGCVRGPQRNPNGFRRVFMAVVTKGGSKTSPREVIERAKAEGVEFVDVRFIDLPATWQHFSLPLGELEEDSFVTGLGFDGSSIRGFQAIDESDMMPVPDPDSATIDPVLSHKTLFLICDVVDPISREPYSRDARLISKKADEHLRRSGIADVSYWGPEAAFYLFTSLRFDQNAFSGYYHIDSEEGICNSGKNSEPNLAFRPRHKEGYFPGRPPNSFRTCDRKSC